MKTITLTLEVDDMESHSPVKISHAISGDIRWDASACDGNLHAILESILSAYKAMDGAPLEIKDNDIMERLKT